MEMGLLTRYARFMELSSGMHPRRTPQLPLWIRHNPRGVLLASHGDCRRQDNWAVHLCFNSVSSVSARAQYFLVPTRAGCYREHPSSARKDMLQNSARAQGQRLFSSKENARWLMGKTDLPDPPSFADALNSHKMANGRKEMLEALKNLKAFAKEKGYCDNESHANDLVSRVVSSLVKDRHHQWQKPGGRDDHVVKESLRVAHLLLENAPEEILKKLHDCNKEVKLLEPFLEKIIGDYGGSADHRMIKLANKILAKLRSIPK